MAMLISRIRTPKKRLGGLVGVIWLAAVLTSWGDPPRNRTSLNSAPPMVLIDDDPGVQMRAKLSRSKDILAGLVRRDFDSMSRAAKELKRISAATDWPYANDAKFQSSEYRISKAVRSTGCTRQAIELRRGSIHISKPDHDLYSLPRSRA